MDNVPYEEWAEALRGILLKNGIKEGLVCELACGTGSITEKMRSFGYDMIGIDNSAEMLAVAERKRTDDGILYLLQDMRELELYGTVEAFLCVCDGLNYLLSEEDLIKVFRLVNNYLEKDGLFIFDLNTRYKYEEILGENTIAENRENMSFIWENFFHEEDLINEYDLTIFIKDEEAGKENSFLRFEEVHYQKAYEAAEVIACIEKAGMEFVSVIDAETGAAPREESERLLFIAKEKFQEGKTYR